MTKNTNFMAKYSNQIIIAIVAVALLTVVSCATRHAEPQIEGQYSYEHSFDYELQGNHLDVHETGTMDFYADGSAIDSARQVYEVTFQDGSKVMYSFNYVSPSRWSLDGEDFHFAGIKDEFRMEVLESFVLGYDNDGQDISTQMTESDPRWNFSQEIIKVVSGSIDYEYKFHLDTLSSTQMKWSFTYKDGHSDTWTFIRN